MILSKSDKSKRFKMVARKQKSQLQMEKESKVTKKKILIANKRGKWIYKASECSIYIL